MANQTVSVPIGVAPGEFFDRLTITALKCEHADGPQADVLRAQKDRFDQSRGAHFPPSAELESLVAQLEERNRMLWGLENQVRSFDDPLNPAAVEAFATVAHAIFSQNEDRAEIKRQIDLLFQPASGEAKIYRNANLPKA